MPNRLFSSGEQAHGPSQGTLTLTRAARHPRISCVANEHRTEQYWRGRFLPLPNTAALPIPGRLPVLWYSSDPMQSRSTEQTFLWRLVPESLRGCNPRGHALACSRATRTENTRSSRTPIMGRLRRQGKSKTTSSYMRNDRAQSFRETARRFAVEMH